MYRKKNIKQLSFENFYLPFGGKLRSDNRWVKLAKIIPWELAESFYAKQFSKTGAPAIPARVALGALIIKERLGVSDEEAVEQIRENPYLQYFLGFKRFSDEPPFDPSMYVHFRKRFSLEQLNEINEAIANRERRDGEDEDDDDSSSGTSSGGNKGKLIVDATCAPADIRYPTDIALVNEARQKSEKIIDILFAPLKGRRRKPRTYRRKAQRLFVSYSKMRKCPSRKRRAILGKQLRFLKRNLKTIACLSREVPLSILDRNTYRTLLVIHEVYRQQQWMYENRSHSVRDRIVSISQPHVRPIVRGKASAPTEFGAKLSASLVDGFAYCDRLSWDAYNESTDLIDQVEAYRRRFGHYPEVVNCDKIYHTRQNRAYCRERDIRISGPPLGRPAKLTPEEQKAKRQLLRQDELDRIPIEGKFGQAKRRFGLGKVMAKLAATSEAMIAITFIVLNLEKWLKKPFVSFFIFLWHKLADMLADTCIREKNPLQMLLGGRTCLGCQRT
jgi:hypothetical protein